jgi:hypothetical protein
MNLASGALPPPTLLSSSPSRFAHRLVAPNSVSLQKIASIITSMTTPVRRPLGDPLRTSIPSKPFLMQLLDDIKGNSTPTVCGQPISHSTPTTQPVPVNSTHASSVWVGGDSIAQDARNKLREADETRSRKASVVARNEAPVNPRPTLRLQTSGFDVRSPASGRSTRQASPDRSGGTKRTVVGKASPHTEFDEAARLVDPMMGGLQPPSSVTFNTEPSWIPYDLTQTASPLMFCDSDMSSSPSTDEPISAVSTTFTDITDATSVSEGYDDSCLVLRNTDSRTSPIPLQSELPTSAGPMDLGGADETTFRGRFVSRKTPTWGCDCKYTIIAHLSHC